MSAYSVILEKALAVAATAHRDQVRKGSQVPYIIHPAHAAMILLKYQFPEEAVVAAVLHDVVEDTDVKLLFIETEFGAAVARIVDDVSEKKSAPATGDGPPVKLPWRTRKQEQLERLANADALAAAVKTADALHNCRSMLQDLAKQGADLWQRFRGSQADQLWYYTSLAAVLRRRLGGHPICDELDAAVGELADWHVKTSP
jgi:(p)ppGpp synthase/HD superfamily hydrolase